MQNAKFKRRSPAGSTFPTAGSDGAAAAQRAEGRQVDLERFAS